MKSFLAFSINSSVVTLVEIQGFYYGKVDQYSLDGEFIKTWDCILYASKFLGLKKGSAITLACKDWNKTSGGYRWRYHEER